MTYISIVSGFAFGNLIGTFMGVSLESALERSFFQAIAVLACFAFTRKKD